MKTLVVSVPRCATAFDCAGGMRPAKDRSARIGIAAAAAFKRAPKAGPERRGALV